MHSCATTAIWGEKLGKKLITIFTETISRKTAYEDRVSEDNNRITDKTSQSVKYPDCLNGIE